MASPKPDRRPPHQKKTGEHGETHWTASLHVFVLVGFAVAQPRFDLLARQAEFFAFRQAASGDIAALVVILSDRAPCIASGLRVGSVSEREEPDEEAASVFGSPDQWAIARAAGGDGDG